MNYKTLKKSELIALILQLEAQSNMRVTACQIYPFKDGPKGTVRGFANIVLNDALQLRSLRIMNSENGLYVGYPTDPFYRGDEFRTLCCPITKAMRETIDNAVLSKYHEVTTEATNG